jgi:hypothetical protein
LDCGNESSHNREGTREPSGGLGFHHQHCRRGSLLPSCFHPRRRQANSHVNEEGRRRAGSGFPPPALRFVSGNPEPLPPRSICFSSFHLLEVRILSRGASGCAWIGNGSSEAPCPRGC